MVNSPSLPIKIAKGRREVMRGSCQQWQQWTDQLVAGDMATFKKTSSQRVYSVQSLTHSLSHCAIFATCGRSGMRTIHRSTKLLKLTRTGRDFRSVHLTQRVHPVQPLKIAGNLLRTGQDLWPVRLSRRVRPVRPVTHWIDRNRKLDSGVFWRGHVVWRDRIHQTRTSISWSHNHILSLDLRMNHKDWRENCKYKPLPSNWGLRICLHKLSLSLPDAPKMNATFEGNVRTLN